MVKTNMPDKTQIIKALDILKELNDKKDVKVLNDNERIVLQFSQKFVPIKCEQIIHIVLPNKYSEHDDDEICLFVKDNDKYNREYEASIQHYKDLLTKNDIHSKIDIVPMKKLKLEYNDFEAKRRLSNSYEIFLADARIFRLLPALLGKHFIGRKRFLTKIDFEVQDLKKELDKCLKTVHICLRGHGPISQCTVGHMEMSSKKLADNIVEAIKQFSLHMDYGFCNIRSINVKTNSSASVPLYISLDEINVSDSSNQVATGPELEDEVSTVVEGKIRITRDGRVAIISNNQKVDVITNTFELPVYKKHRRRNKKSGTVARQTAANEKLGKDKNALSKQKSLDKHILKSKDKNVLRKNKKNKEIRVPLNNAEGGIKNNIQNIDLYSQAKELGVRVKRKAVGVKRIVKKIKIDSEKDSDSEDNCSIKSSPILVAKKTPGKKESSKKAEILNANSVRAGLRSGLKK